MRPQDIVVLLKILCNKNNKWYNKDLAKELFLSPSEISNSLERNAIAGLIDTEKRKVKAQALLEFLKFGVPYVFPQRPGNISRGLPTAHSHPFMRQYFEAETNYVWPDAEYSQKGLSLQPLYSGAVKAAKEDETLYLMLALIDVLRSGKVREKKIAIDKLEKLLGQ